MIKLMNLTMPYTYTEQELYVAVAKRLKIHTQTVEQITYLKKSIDARKKTQIFVVLTLLVCIKEEERILKRFASDRNVQKYTPYHYVIPSRCALQNSHKRPVIVGFGPAGMFAAYLLAKAGLCPLVLERGLCVEQRRQDVELFRRTGRLDPSSNVQFGEGGAGTFSDGKLTTGIKDNRIRFVLETFVSCGAPEEILYLAKPHIGTDRLIGVVREMRKAIQKNGGEIVFGARLTKLLQKNNTLYGVVYEKNGIEYTIGTTSCILAVGHSARDTFSMLYESGIAMVQKNFAVGMRIEHPQYFIDKVMYGDEKKRPQLMPAADYKLVVHLPNGKSLYTFCMCPGGEVVAASSEPERLVVNGMSNYKRDGRNANSALLVGVSADELHSTHPLAGIEFQRKLEHDAFLAGGGNYYAPVCCVGDFLQKQTPRTLGDVVPTYTPGVSLVLPDQYLPAFIAETLRLGIPEMDRKIHGFAMADAVLTGVESRSSSPVRIIRDATCMSTSLKGLYPCGEGAGYAGGITSAAVDGLRCAEQLIQNVTTTDL